MSSTTEDSARGREEKDDTLVDSGPRAIAASPAIAEWSSNGATGPSDATSADAPLQSISEISLSASPSGSPIRPEHLPPGLGKSKRRNEPSGDTLHGMPVLQLLENGDIAAIADAFESERPSQPGVAVEPVPIAQLSLPSISTAPRISDLPELARFGRYGLLGRLAYGGMAEIFLAREQMRSGPARHVVVKRILPHVADDESFVHMFIDEARLAARLQHPAICHVFEFGQTSGSYFIAMEWVDGVSLAKLIRRGRDQLPGGLPPSIVAKIGSQIAEALHYAHCAGDENGQPLHIVHRDVSPQNIMLGYRGGTKLLDFGVARSAAQISKTGLGIVKGKLNYLAPELCRGDTFDGRADVYSLGVCMWEALAGRPLFKRATEFETLRAICDDAVPSLSAVRTDVDPALDAIIQRAVAKDIGARFQSADEVREALEGYLRDAGRSVAPSAISSLLQSLFASEVEAGPTLESPLRNDGIIPVSASNPPPSLQYEKQSTKPEKNLTAGRSVEVSRASLATVGLSTVSLSTPDASAMPPLGASAPSAPRVLVGDLAQSEAPVPSASAVVSRVPDRPSRARWVPWTIGGVCAALGLMYWLAAREGVEGATPATSRRTHAASVIARTLIPSPAAVPPNPSSDPVAVAPAVAPAAETALPETNPESPSFEPTQVAGDSTAPATPVTSPAPQISTAVLREQPPRPRATLSINTTPWSKVFLGGRLLGHTPIGGLRVDSGRLRLRFEDRDGQMHRRTVAVRPGEDKALFVDLTSP